MITVIAENEKNKYPLNIISITPIVDVLGISFRHIRDAEAFRSIVEKHDEHFVSGLKRRNDPYPTTYELYYGPNLKSKIVFIPPREDRRARRLVRVHNVHPQMLLFLLCTLPNEHTLSYVELALDFFTNSNNRLFKFFRKYLYLSRPGAEMKIPYDDTIYPHNNRKTSSKKGIIYRKAGPYYDEGEEYIRVEVTLKRTPLRNLGINKVIDIVDVDGSMDLRYFKLRKFRLRSYQKSFNYQKRHYPERELSKDDYLVVKDKYKNRSVTDAFREGKKYVPRYVLKKHPLHAEFEEFVSKYRFFSKKIAKQAKSIWRERFGHES